MQVGKTVPAHHELPRKLSGLQRSGHVYEAALVHVDLVRKTTLQRFARVVQTLLRVAYAIEQLPAQRVRATVDLPVEIDDVRDN